MPFNYSVIEGMNFLFDEAQLPKQVRDFLSESKPTKPTFDLSKGYELLRSWTGPAELELIEILAGLGKLNHLKIILENRSVRKHIGNHYNLVLRLAAENGHLEVVDYLFTHYKSAIKDTIKEVNKDPARYPNLWENDPLIHAARNGHFQVVEYLLSDKSTKYVRDSYNLNRSALEEAASNGHLHIVKYLLLNHKPSQPNICFNENRYTDNSMIAHILDISSNHPQVINHFLTYANVFSYAEMHEREYGAKVHFYIKRKVAELRLYKAELEAKEPNAVFNLHDEEEIKVCFYMIRNLIRRNSPAVLDDIRFLLSIPAVKNMVHLAVLDSQPNELIRLAVTLGNEEAATILLAIPAVRDLAAQNNFYANEAQGQFDLRAMAQDRESSMMALSTEEQKRLEGAINRYQPEMKKKGVENIFKDLQETLEKRYKDNPAKIQVNNKDLILPLSWNAFQEMKMDAKTRKKALEAYYQHPDHSAYRYLSKPNAWMHKNASYIYINDERTERWSTFEDYKPFIAMLYLAAKDPEMKPTDGYTLDTRVENFIKELSLIDRAHNWDSPRINPNTKKEEEYDDLEGDRPSCYSGVKRRLFQSVCGHPLFVMLTKSTIDQELKDFAKDFVKYKIKEMKLEEDKIKVLARDCEVHMSDPFLDLKDDVKSVIAIPKEEQDKFIKSLSDKHHDQFDKSLRLRVLAAFNTAKLPNSDAADALVVGGGINWNYLFKPASKIILSSVEAKETSVIASSFFSHQHFLGERKEMKDHKQDTQPKK